MPSPPAAVRATRFTTKDCLQALYHAFDAQGGTFTVTGGTINRTPELARDPREQGRETTIAFSVDSGVLTTRTDAGDDWLWRKLG